MGRPYMPWQQHAADIAGECDSTGRLYYREVVITVPRQSGKTTLILSVVVGRAEAGPRFGGRQRMLYAAQTREDARDKWKEDYLEDLRASKVMRGKFTERIANGSEKVTFLSSRSTFGPIATKESSGHGKVLDFGCLDEAFAQTDSSVEGSWLPAMITRPMAQFWVPSTAGTAASTYFRDKVDKGRLHAEAELDRGAAYIEYSADDNVDPADEDEWWKCMPALGYTQTIEAMRDEYIRMKLNDFKRAFLNIWVDKVTEAVLPEADWAVCRRPEAERVTRPVIVIDVSADRTHSVVAIGAAGSVRDEAGDEVFRPLVRIVQYAPGTGWVVDRVKALVDELDPAAVIIDGAGPVRSLKADLENEYIDVTVMSAGDVVEACGAFYDAVLGHEVTHDGDECLETAVTGAERRQLGDAWAWTRRVSLAASRADICPLVAVTSAYWGQVKFGDDPGYDISESFG